MATDDYINYLDAVYKEVLQPFKNKKVKINVLGFSQATATVCRWIANKNPAINNLILWAGFFPHDLDFERDKNYFNNIQTTLLIGNSDEFYNLEEIEKHRKTMLEKEFIFEFIHFEGKHEIPEEILLQLVQTFKAV